MIGEFEMRAGQFDFRHVARGAIFTADFAQANFSLLWGMTRRAFRIVRGGLGRLRFVNVMTSDTTDATVIRIAFAIENAIRLKAHIVQATEARQGCDVFDAAVTGGAKFLT